LVFDILCPGNSVYVPGVIDSPSSTTMLLADKTRNVLVDPGGFSSMKRLETALREKDFGVNDITDILLTHLHMDHAFNTLFFPNATVHLGREYLTKDYSQFGPIIGRMYSVVVDNWKSTHVFEEKLLWDCVEIHDTPFHSREHKSFVVHTENVGKVLVCGDLCERRYHFHEMRKGMRSDQAAEIILGLSEQVDVLVFSHDLPIYKE